MKNERVDFKLVLGKRLGDDLFFYRPVRAMTPDRTLFCLPT